jgi:hypothetical protein
MCVGAQEQLKRAENASWGLKMLANPQNWVKNGL